jgi:hypothetical protein
MDHPTVAMKLAAEARMEHPDWYPAWRREAFRELVEKNKYLGTEFKLGHWARYDYDLVSGTVRFSQDGIVRVMAEVDIAGTTSSAGDDWLWSWANPHFPRERTTEAERVRAFGLEQSIAELTQESVKGAGPRRPGTDLDGLGWELTAVMVRVTDVLGAYCPPSRNDAGRLYLTCKSIAWVS